MAADQGWATGHASKINVPTGISQRLQNDPKRSLKNIGRRKLAARKKNMTKNSEPVYRDEMEELYHSLSLQIEGIPESLRSLAADWYPAKLVPVKSLPREINLLYNYQFSTAGAENFWLEPGETLSFGYPAILASGDYLAKVTFVGAGGDGEFWGRRFYVHVPSKNTVALSQGET